MARGSARGSGVSIVLHPGTVTTGEAVLNEAIAEEHIAAEERVRKEEADAEKRGRGSTPAWIASLIYAKSTARR